MSRIFAVLFLPPLNFFLCFVMFYFLRHKYGRAAKTFFSLGIIIFLFMSVAIVPLSLLKYLEGENPAYTIASAEKADAIVVMGAGRYFHAPEYQNKDTIKQNVFERLRLAARIYRAQKIPLLTTGGTPDGEGKSEAELMGETLTEDFQVPVRWLETLSVNSMDNARKSAKILLPLHYKKIILVTHAIHMPRAKFSFERAGFTVIPAPVGFLTSSNVSLTNLHYLIPSIEGLDYSFHTWHELVGMLWYRIRF